MQKNGMDLQDTFLNQLCRTGALVTVFLMNGFQMHGAVTGYDSFVLVLDSEGKQQMIYKHAISTIAPARVVNWSQEITE